MYQVLEGIKVVEVSSWIFMPTAGAVLADWGADVVKVEDPKTGDPIRGMSNAFRKEGRGNPMVALPNRGKRSVAVDIASPEGHAIFDELINQADVFLTSYRAPARRKLGIEVDDIRAVNPNIIYARGTGQGSSGPDADKGGYDLASTWARSGLAYALTAPGGEPPPLPGSIGDLMGGLTAAGGIAAALFRRERTGAPSTVEVSLYGIGTWMMAQAITAAGLGIANPLRHREKANNPLVNCFRTRDDRWIYFALLQADRFWEDLCRRIGREDLIDDPRFASDTQRMQNGPDCVHALDEVFAARTLEEWTAVLATFDGVWSPAMSPFEVLQDPQLLANGYFPEIEAPNGERYRVVASPMQFDDRPLGELLREPEHGEHTEEVLLELGMSWEDIGNLKDCHAIL